MSKKMSNEWGGKKNEWVIHSIHYSAFSSLRSSVWEGEVSSSRLYIYPQNPAELNFQSLCSILIFIASKN